MENTLNNIRVTEPCLSQRTFNPFKNLSINLKKTNCINFSALLQRNHNKLQTFHCQLETLNYFYYTRNLAVSRKG